MNRRRLLGGALGLATTLLLPSMARGGVPGTVKRPSVIAMLDRAHRWLAEHNLLTERGHRAEALYLHADDLCRFKHEMTQDAAWSVGMQELSICDPLFRGLPVQSGMALSRPGTVRALIVHRDNPNWIRSSIFEVPYADA